MGTKDATANLAGAGFGAASTIVAGASASPDAYVGCGLKNVPGSADANVTVGDICSAWASAQSAGKRKFTVSEGAMLAMVATTVDDGSGVRLSRALKPAARPPSPAPPIMARQANTLLLIPLDRPRMSPTC